MPEHRCKSAILVLILLLAGCGGNSGPPPTDTGARSATRAFFDAIIHEDWPAAFALLNAESQSRLGVEHFSELARTYRAAIGFVPSGVEVRSCDEQGDRAIARVILEGKVGKTRRRFRDEARLQKAGKQWTIAPPENFGQPRQE
jgi:hypothetical protein